jgi:hypothetical protein
MAETPEDVGARWAITLFRYARALRTSAVAARHELDAMAMTVGEANVDSTPVAHALYADAELPLMELAGALVELDALKASVERMAAHLGRGPLRPPPPKPRPSIAGEPKVTILGEFTEDLPPESHE